jgi:hypothetical protein
MEGVADRDIVDRWQKRRLVRRDDKRGQSLAEETTSITIGWMILRIMSLLIGRVHVENRVAAAVARKEYYHPSFLRGQFHLLNEMTPKLAESASSALPIKGEEQSSALDVAVEERTTNNDDDNNSKLGTKTNATSTTTATTTRTRRKGTRID